MVLETVGLRTRAYLYLVDLALLERLAGAAVLPLWDAIERWLAGLNDEGEKALESWLKKMPERIPQAVEPG